MIEPKTFYRELDAVLSKIDIEKSDKNFFIKILDELKKRFSAELNIKGSCIYEKRGDNFVLIHRDEEAGRLKIRETISGEVDSIKDIIRGGKKIVTSPEMLKDFVSEVNLECRALAAISIHTPVRKWIILFVLKEEWVEEEITLFLNAMRTALNYRLFSEMMKNDLVLTEQIQKSLLPKMAPDIEGYDIYGFSQPAAIVGGDFFDFYQFDEEDLVVSIGDASGHGLPAALLVRDVVIGLRMGLAKEMRLAHTLNKLNNVIQRSTYSTNFVSIFVGEIEQDGHLFYVNAGHPAPFLIKKDRIVDLDATGITLGFLPEVDLGRSYVRLENDTVLVLYSDGIIERERGEGEEFGIERLKKLVMENHQKSSKDIVSLVFDSVDEFGKRKSWEDDATLVVIKRL